jgi:HD-GYP domain-containing protein (c-di-GMP phosphodiesterase class II)
MAATVSLSIDELRVGVTCSHAVLGENDILLIGAGTPITANLISGLQDRGISHIDVDPRDLAALRGEPKKKAAPRNVPKRKVVEFVTGKQVKDLLADRHDEVLSEKRAAALTQNMLQAQSAFRALEQDLASNGIRSVESMTAVSDSYARIMVEDHDQTVGTMNTVDTTADEVMAFDQRSVRLSVLGMSLAIQMELDGQETLEVGMTGLLHDVGIKQMPDRFRNPLEKLNPEDRWEFQKHPRISVDCVSSVIDLSPPVLVAMLQVHEQFDGSGYPRGLKGNRIHKYARILNFADTYLDLTTPNSARNGIVPHDALAIMLQQAGRGVFDPMVVRAFLNIETMFPLGSDVELNSGEKAQVIRRPRSGYSTPVLLGADGKRIEMESDPSVEILRPVSSERQMRVAHDATTAIQWHPMRHFAV